MAIQLTPEQEQRIQAVVRAGAYSSTTEALDAAVAAVETAAAPDFEGTQEELDEMLLEDLKSGNPIEAEKAFGRACRLRPTRWLPSTRRGIRVRIDLPSDPENRKDSYSRTYGLIV
jgi:Arc/MetJ-type ribon-helix-helix transcriptional regulator